MIEHCKVKTSGGMIIVMYDMWCSSVQYLNVPHVGGIYISTPPQYFTKLMTRGKQCAFCKPRVPP